MKILIVQDFLRSGGTERQAILLANAFAAAGNPVTLLTFRPGGALAPTVAPAVERVVLQSRDTGLDWFAPALHATVAREHPDVVLCMGRMTNCYAGSLQRRLATTVVATMRTGKPLPWLFRRSLRTVRHIVANSHAARSTLITRYGINPETISVIHNSLVFSAAADLPQASPIGASDPAVSTESVRASTRRESTRERYQASGGTVVLLSVAMFRPEKRQRELIEIAAGLPNSIDWQLWLVGEGPSRSACEEVVRTRNLGSRVRFLGFMADPSDAYAAADVAVHASANESLSNFLIEAQAHGLPAVAYETQGIAECFVPGETGWVIPRDDRAAFRAALERLARAPVEARSARVAAAQRFAHSRFAPATQAAAYLELFARLNAPRV